MIEAHLAEAGTARTLRYWLSQALGNEAYGEELAAACERLDVGKDEIIAAQGEPERRRFRTPQARQRTSRPGSLTYVIRVMAERLSFASKVIDVLSR